MMKMANDLYNCCTGNVAPDWSQFKSLYVGGCITETSGDDTWVSPEPFETADFFSVYARHHSGEAEAITDISERAKVSAIASQLSEISGLPILGAVPS